MKLHSNIIALFSIVSAATLFAQTPPPNITWETYIQQTQVNGSSGAPRSVADQGSEQSLPIGNDGSVFKLWGWRLENGVVVAETLIDTIEVGTFIPQAEITIRSLDPSTQPIRSRVDQSFSVEIDISGILVEANAPESAKSVLLEHVTYLYEDGTFDGSSIEETRTVTQGLISTNGLLTLPFANSNIEVADAARRAGREEFTVYALADGNVPQRVIAQQSIEMYPLPEGAILGIDESEPSVSIPDFQVRLARIYPTSSSWIEFYEGQFSAGQRGTVLPNTQELPSHDLPVNLSNLDFEDFTPKTLPDSHTFYTVVLRTSSPFPGESIENGGIVLDHKTLLLGKPLRVNGMVTTFE